MDHYRAIAEHIVIAVDFFGRVDLSPSCSESANPKLEELG